MNIITKTFNGQPVGITEQDGTAWLIVADIATALGYQRTHKATMRISKANLSSTMRTGWSVGTTNEAGLGELLLNSRKAKAREFSQWAASEVFTKGASNGCHLGAIIQLLQQMQRDGCACSCSGGNH
ncbi:MAG: Bro-N domain-containing protein [Nitrosomonadales bacterium]